MRPNIENRADGPLQSYVKVRLTLPTQEWETSTAPDFAIELAKHLFRWQAHERVGFTEVDRVLQYRRQL